MKKIWKFLTSMKFAIILLVLLALACAFSSLITQGQSFAWYAEAYSERTAAVIMALHLDDAFHSWWFVLLSAVLCLNLLFCNILHFPKNVERTKRLRKLESYLQTPATVSRSDVEHPEEIFRKLHFGRVFEENGMLFSVRNRLGIWGPWFCHLGILLLILGFALGQYTKSESTVYGLPGQTKPVGDTGLNLTIDAFEVILREDDTVEQYKAAITVSDPASGDSRSAEISVNNPAKLFGRTFYQNSTGWAADVTVQKDGKELQKEALCAGEFLAVADKPELIIYLRAFYPDYVQPAGEAPRSASGELNNPAYLYMVYYKGELLGMNTLLAGEELTIDEYTVLFSNPRSYTLIQVKEDRFTGLALIGGLITMIGIFMALYLQQEKLWAMRQDDGKWTVYGSSRKGGVLFKDKFEEACGKNESKK